jgi:hypothetical protein
MAQSNGYIRIADLLPPGYEAATEATRCEYVLNHLEQAFSSVGAMSNEERDMMLKLLTCWMVAEKFGPHARVALSGFQKFSLAECLYENPDWKVPTFVKHATTT